MMEKSCGTIPYIIKDGIIHYLLIRTKSGRHCSFPKGHVEGDETEAETALRETWEETSIRAEICSDFRRKITYRMKNGVTKTVIYFIARYSEQKPHHNSTFEYYNFLVLPYSEAYRKLTFPSAKALLKEVDAYVVHNLL